jgi:IS30 family transposase
METHHHHLSTTDRVTLMFLKRQDELDAFAFQLNTRPRKRLGFKPPLEVFIDLINRTQETPSGVR